MELNQFLVWLASGGSIIAVSWLCERWAFFQKQTADAKQYIVYGASVALAMGAFAVNTHVSPEVLAQIAPYFGIAATAFVSIFLGKVFHALNKAQGKG